jgi:hypothetical protein
MAKDLATSSLLKLVQKNSDLPDVRLTPEQAEAITDAILTEVRDQVMTEYESLTDREKKYLERNSDALVVMLQGIREGVISSIAEVTDSVELVSSTQESTVKTLEDISQVVETTANQLDQTSKDEAPSTFTPNNVAPTEKPSKSKFLSNHTPGLITQFLGGMIGMDFDRVNEFFERRRAANAEEGNVAADKASRRTPSPSTTTSQSSLSSMEEDNNLSREEQHEASLEQKKSRLVLEKQSETLIEIRDLLQKQTGGISDAIAAAAAGAAAGSNGSVVDRVIDALGLASAAKGGANLLKKGAGFAKTLITKGASAVGSVAKGALAGGKSLLKNTKALKIGGGVIAAASGAYTAYTGFKGASEEAIAKLSEIDALEEAGEITPEEAAAARQAVELEETEAKGGAIGQGTGEAAGGIAGAVLGSALGPLGTIAGGYLGSKAGGWLGKHVGGAIGTIKGKFFDSKDVKTNIANSSPIDVGNVVSSVGAPVLGSAISGAAEPEIFSPALKNTMKRTDTLEATKQKDTSPTVVVQAPPPTVINNQQPPMVMPAPFAGGIKNGESSVSSFMSSRYAF